MSETLPTPPTNTNIDFLFARPPLIDQLTLGSNIAIAFGALASRLTAELRTRTLHPDGRRENVAEHGFMLNKVAVSIASELYPWLDRGKIAIHCNNHDDIEGWVGDTPTDSISGHDPIQKHLREREGLVQQREEYIDIAPSYVDDMETYEAQEEDEARFVRIVDKFMVLLIHIPNEGAVIRANYSYEQFVKDTLEVERKLLEQYPEWIELIIMRTEIAMYVGNKYIRDWVSAPDYQI